MPFLVVAYLTIYTSKWGCLFFRYLYDWESKPYAEDMRNSSLTFLLLTTINFISMKSNIKNILKVIAIAAVACVTFASCSKERTSSKIVGQWKTTDLTLYYDGKKIDIDLETEMLTINDTEGIQHNYGLYMLKTYITFYENGNMDFMGVVSGTYEVSGNEVTLKAYGETHHLQLEGDKLLDISEFSADGYSIVESSRVVECVEPDGKNHTFKIVEVLSKVN